MDFEHITILVGMQYQGFSYEFVALLLAKSGHDTRNEIPILIKGTESRSKIATKNAVIPIRTEKISVKS